MEDKKKIISKKDIILIVVILVVAAGIWGALTLFDSPPEEATVYGEIFFGPNSIMLVPLNVDQTFSTPVNPNVIFEVRDGAIGFVESNCLDQVCVNTGFICGEGFFPFAACLPNGLILTIHVDDILHNED
jgi:hypothetical protein